MVIHENEDALLSRPVNQQRFISSTFQRLHERRTLKKQRVEKMSLKNWLSESLFIVKA
jgi:hypothetical protein